MDTFQELQEQLKGLRKCLISPKGNIYATDNLHEVLGIEICQENCWNWKISYYSAVDFLVKEKNFIKVSNYGAGRTFRSVMISASSSCDIEDMAYFIADIFKLRMEII